MKGFDKEINERKDTASAEFLPGYDSTKFVPLLPKPPFGTIDPVLVCPLTLQATSDELQMTDQEAVLLQESRKRRGLDAKEKHRLDSQAFRKRRKEEEKIKDEVIRELYAENVRLQAENERLTKLLASRQEEQSDSLDKPSFKPSN